MAYFERFVSRRYLFKRGKRGLASLITFISIAGVTVGVGALIIVISIIEGIDDQIFSQIVDVYPHVKVSSSPRGGLDDPAPVLEIIRARSEVALAEPIISRDVLLEYGSRSTETQVPARIMGIRELGRGQLFDIPNTRDGSNIRLGRKEILLSWPLAGQLRVRQGQRIIATTGIFVKAGTDYVPRKRALDVVGLYQTELQEFDVTTAFVSTETARNLFGLEGGADYVHVKMNNPFAVRAFKEALAEELGPGYKITTWEEANGEYFQALRLEKLGLFVILFLVVIVASFAIVGTLILTVMEKTREIGILKAIGASDGMIRRTFLNSGLVIGFVGTFTGLALGLIGCYAVSRIELTFSPTVLAFNRLPVVIEPRVIALIVLGSLTISLIAAVFPAAQAARLNPIEALRHN